MFIGMDDIIAVENIGKKINVYKVDEIINFQKIRDVYERLSNNYVSSNKKNLDNLNQLIIDKMKVLSSIHEQYITTIEVSIDKYRNLAANTEEEFKKIGEQ